jgi:predicted HicB family RNase H-like nuclease
MAIAKKPQRHHKDTSEKTAERFIASASSDETALSREGKIATTLRFDPNLLARIDAAAKRRGVSRSAWIQYTLSRALDMGEV